MKIYKSMEEIERDFFPALYKERMRNLPPEEIGKRLAMDYIKAVRDALANPTNSPMLQ